MAHEIEDNRAFFVNKKPWHNVGTVLNAVPDFDSAIRMLTLDQVYEKRELATHHNGELVPVQNSMIVMRSDGKEFSTVGKEFELLQPSQAFSPFRGLIDSGLVDLEAGGMLRGGSQAWFLGKVKENGTKEIVKNDPIKCYFLMATGFDGTLRNVIQDCNERVVCANTLGFAMREDNKNINLKFKHTKNVMHKINNVEALVKGRIEGFNKQVESYQYLASKKITSDIAQKYIGQVFLTMEEFNGQKEIGTKKANTVSHVIDLIDTQKGLEYVPAIRGTAWQAYNAVTEYVTHEYGRTSDSRIHSQFFGESAKLNQKAMELALAL